MKDNIFHLDIETVSKDSAVMTLRTEDGVIHIGHSMAKKINELIYIYKKQSDITDEEYEEAVSVLDEIMENGITDTNEELTKEMMDIIKEYEQEGY